MGSVTACMFDVGNSIMCTGGTYAFVAEYTAASGSKKGMDLKSFAKRLITSPPLVAYVVMFILAVANIDTPPVILTPVSYTHLKLVNKHGKYYLHIPVTYEVEESNISDICNVVGIDRGIN